MSFLLKPLVYLAVPVFVLRSASPSARYYVNLGLYIGSLVVVSAWGAVVGVAMLVARRPLDLNHHVAKTFYSIAGSLLGITIDVEGEEHLQTRPAVMMGNHQSMLDVLILGRVFPRRATIIAKKELRWSPIGPFMSLGGALFVDRANSATAIQSLAQAGDSMKRLGSSVWIFPEGTRSSSERSSMLPFKKGGFHLAVQAQIPIIPVVTENYWPLYHSGVFNGGTIKVRVLPPISTADATSADVPSLATSVRETMLQALNDMSVPGPSTPPTTTTTLSTPSAPPPPASEPITTTTIAPAPPTPTPEDAPSTSTSTSTPTTGPEDRVETLSESGSSFRKTDGSENGAETEEDEGMVLVGHPT